VLVGERRRKIIDILASDDRAQVGDLAARFGVSESTIRRDLQLLSENGVVERTHGGVLPPSRFEPSFGQKETENRAQKRAIARVAAQFVESGHTVFLDGGTTTLELARILRRFESREAANRARGPSYLLGRPGRAKEIAAGALFLACDESSFMTGADLLLDGGYLAFKGTIETNR